jgi:hypothetical protein
MGKTIARSSKKQIAAIVARVKDIQCYTLDNQFSGESIGLDRLQTTIATIHYNSNCWVRLVLAEVAS